MGTSQAAWFGVDSLHLDSASGTPLTDGLKNCLRGQVSGWWARPAIEVHWFIIDMKQSFTVTKVRGRSLRAADPTKVNIYVSDNKANWGSAVATDISTWQDTSAWVEYNSTDKKGRYVKVEVTATEIGEPHFLEWGGFAGKIFDIYCSDLPDCAELTINLMNEVVTTNDAANYVDVAFRIPWDGSKYDTIETVQLVVNGYGGGGDPAGECHVELYDFTNSSSLAQVSTVGYGAVFDFDNTSMPAGVAKIGINIKGAATVLREAHLNIKLRAPTAGGNIKARIIRDIGWRMPDRTNPTGSYVEHQCKRLLLDTSKYDGTVTYYFGACAKVPSGSTGYCELWNNTDSSQLSELTWTETSLTYKMSSSISPTTNKEYTTRIKYTGFLGSTTPRNAHLIIDCVGLSKYEFDYLTAMDADASTKFSTNAYVNSSHFAGYQNISLGVTKALYAEGCAKKSAVDNGYLRTEDDGVAMSNTALIFGSTSFSRFRNPSATTEPANYSDLECVGKGYTSSSSTLQTYVHRLIVQVSDFDKSPSAGTNYQVNIGDVWKDVSAMQINIGDSWKAVAGAQVNIGDAWKTIF